VQLINVIEATLVSTFSSPSFSILLFLSFRSSRCNDLLDAWISGKRRSPASAMAVREFLTGRTLNTSATARDNLFVSDSYLEEEVLKRSSHLRVIIYIDADNAASFLDSLSLLLPDEQQQVLVICVLAKDSRKTTVLEALGKSSWLYATYTLTLAKDAADHAITYLATTHLLLLKSQAPLAFIIVTHDAFAQEVSSRLQTRGRPCLHVDGSSVTPAMAVLMLDCVDELAIAESLRPTVRELSNLAPTDRLNRLQDLIQEATDPQMIRILCKLCGRAPQKDAEEKRQ